MDAEKIQIKLYALPKNGAPVHPAAFVPVFHDWIRRGVLPELMIDVATYEHVQHGPSILFVGHGSDYVIDAHKGALGLLSSRKRSAPTPSERLGDAVRRTLHVAHLLEQNASLNVTFRTDTVLFRINDRLGAPNTDAGFAAIRDELTAYFSKLYGDATPSITRDTADARELLTIRIALPAGQTGPGVAALLQRAGGAPV